MYPNIPAQNKRTPTVFPITSPIWNPSIPVIIGRPSHTGGFIVMSCMNHVVVLGMRLMRRPWKGC